MQSLKQIGKSGLWIPCQGDRPFLDSKNAAQEVLDYVKCFNISDVFIQVFRSGRAWFPSDTFEAGAISSSLPFLLESLNSARVRCHAWINICNAGISPSPAYIEHLGGKDALLISSDGRDSTADFGVFQLDTAGVWLEPSNPALLNLMAVMRDELLRLPFCGLHLDFIRYPYCIPVGPASWIDCGIDFGYSELALQRYCNSSGERDCFRTSKQKGVVPVSETKGQQFDAWRRQQITNLIRIFRDNLPENIELSVAALAWSDRAYLNAYQDWRAWLSSSLLDTICLMTYTADLNLLRQQIIQAKAFLNNKQTFFAGIGLYKLSCKAELDQQLELIMKLGVSPCYFCANRLPDFVSVP